MFKFPFKRHKNNNHNQRDHHEKFTAATSLSNEGFVFIRCKHNNNNNYNNNNNNIHNIYKNNNNNTNNNDNNCNDSSNINLSNNDLGKANCINTSTISAIKQSHMTTNSELHYDHYQHHHYSYDSNNASTAQNSWRPQLPLPKENSLACNESGQHFYIDHYNEHIREVQQNGVEQEEEVNKTDTMDQSSHYVKIKNNKNKSGDGGTVHYKRFSFRRLFSRKKDLQMRNNDTSTDEDNDRNAGFSPTRKRLRSPPFRLPAHKKKENKSQHHQNYHIVNRLNFGKSNINNGENTTTTTTTTRANAYHDNDDNELFLPVEIVPPLPSKEHYYNREKPIENQSQQHLPSTANNLCKQKSQTPCTLHIVEQGSNDFNLTQGLHSNYTPSQVDSIEHIKSSSNDGEVISINSSNHLKYRSDENLQGVHNYNSPNRKSRAARNERYFKRLSRDSESSHGQAPVQYANQSTQRWQTQPVNLSVYQPLKQVSLASSTKYSQASSRDDYVQHIEPYVQWSQMQQQQQPKNHLYNSVNENKRSISYDSQLHLQNIHGKSKRKVKTLSPPPPPPPRDPLRRIHVNVSNNQNISYNDLRPTSYAFDQMGIPIVPSNPRLTGRCVSDDKIWAQPQSYYQSIQSLNRSIQMRSQSQGNRNYSTKTRTDGKVNDTDYRYVTDSAPRSRRPIHMMEEVQAASRKPLNGSSPPPSSGILRTTKSGLPESPIDKIKATQFWKSLDEKVSQKIQESSLSSRGRNINRPLVNDIKKPRSISSSRVLELRTYPQPIYSEVYKPKPHRLPQNPDTSKQSNDEVDNVVCGTLSIKTSDYNQNDNNKRNSLGNHCKRRSGSDIVPSNDNILNSCKQQHVTERKNCQRNIEQPSLGISHIVVSRKKPPNLEEAISELEAIYHSLGIKNENENEKAEPTLPSPKDFERYALTHADEYDEDDSPAGEPDPIKDDVAYRNIKLANLQHKITDKQPPFGIPLRPTIPAANTDYLKVPAEKLDTCCYQHIRTISPDIIKDDLAVRTLRKEPPPTLSCFKNNFPTYPNDLGNKKHRATRTQSANIYALMRNASKPSGGNDAICYSDFACVHCLDRSGSLSDITQSSNVPNDTPGTLKLLQSLREQENCNEALKVKKLCIPFRHPSQGGAICQLPVVLSPSIKENKLKGTALPCTSATPEPQLIDEPRPSSRMEEALNKIAQDAQESSIKLSHDLQELRKEALISVPKAKIMVPPKDEDALEMKLNEIEKVTKAAKQCSEMLLNALPDRLHTDNREIVEISNYKNGRDEDKLIKAIDEVSEAANKVCEKILKDIQHKDVPRALPINNGISDNKTQMDNINEIAERCMRQFTDLSGNHYNHDNNVNGENMSTTSMSACNLETIEAKSHKHVKDLSHSNLTESPYDLKRETKKEDVTMRRKPGESTVIDEIDQIMRECEEEILSNIITLRPAPEGRASQMIEQVHNNSVPSYVYSSSYSETSGGKSSSPTDNRRISSSITSYQPYSSNGYLKSPSSSEVQALNSTDPIKTISTTSYDVQSTTSNATNLSTSAVCTSPSPSPLNFENVPKDSIKNDIDNDIRRTNGTAKNSRRSSSPFQYNSADELAKIFGDDDREINLSKNSGNEVTCTSLTELSESASNTAAECQACVKQSSLSVNKTAIIQPDIVMNELCLPCYPSTTITKFHTKQNVICHAPLNTSDLLYNINTNYYTKQNQNQNITHNHPSKLEIIDVNKTKLLNRQTEQEGTSNKIFASNLNFIVDNQHQLHDNSNSNDYPTQVESSLNSYSDDLSSNPDSGNVSLADFPLLATSTSNTSASIQLQTNYNSRYHLINTYVTEIVLDQAINVDNNEEQCKNLSENNVQIIERQTNILDINRINGEVEENSHNSLKQNRLPFDEGTTMNALVQTSKESSPIRGQRKESVIIETPKLQLTIMEEKVNYEFNITPELKPFQIVHNNKKITNNLLDENRADDEEKIEEQEEHIEVDDDEILSVNIWPLTETETKIKSEKFVKKDDADLEMPCTSTSSNNMDSKTAVNVLGEQRPMVNGLTLLEHLVVACTLNCLNSNDLLTIFLVIIGVIIIKILTFIT